MASLTPSLERAVAQAAALPPDEQDALAALLLAEIDEAQMWEERLADPRSQGLLKSLAAEALAEDEAGLTEPLDALLAEVRESADQPPPPSH